MKRYSNAEFDGLYDINNNSLVNGVNFLFLR
jgi:hypothetical protein